MKTALLFYVHKKTAWDDASGGLMIFIGSWRRTGKFNAESGYEPCPHCVLKVTTFDHLKARLPLSITD